jgi:pimeloyl-ACP methyl ester carboxylesterase
VAPLGAPGLTEDAWVAGMDPENVKEFRLALAGEDALTRHVEALQAQAEERAAVDPSTIFQDFDLSDSDRAQLARPEIVQIMRESAFEWAVNGVGGWVDDDLAFVCPWGFDLAAVSVPVLIRYGMSDVLVPPAHGEWLAANVPGNIVKIDEVAGHMGADPEEHIAENARWLSAGIAPDGSRSLSTAAD